MRRIMITCAVPAIVAATLLLCGATASASHVGCGDVITEDTTLDSDLVQCSNGLRIAADGVTLDLGGHVIDGLSPGSAGSSGLGVRSDGHSHVTIENGTVQQFFRGVFLINGAHNVVRGVTATQNEVDAIAVSGDDNLLERNASIDNFDEQRISGTGFSVLGDRNRAVRNVAIGNVKGFSVAGAQGVVEHNEATANRSPSTGTSGGFLISGSDFTARQNVASSNGFCGYGLRGERLEFTHNVSFDNFGEAIGFRPLGQEICLLDLDDSVITYNSASNGVRGLHLGCSGIFLDLSDRNVIGKNDASQNDFNGNGSGICLERSHDNVITKNRASGNGDDGIRIRGDSTGNLIEQNFTDGNGDDGIDTASASTTLTRNSADRNGDLGIEAAAGVADGGGNRARANGNPLECVNVSCH